MAKPAVLSLLVLLLSAVACSSGNSHPTRQSPPTSSDLYKHNVTSTAGSKRLPTRPVSTANLTPSTVTPDPDYAATIVASESPTPMGSTDSPDGLWRVDFKRYDCLTIESWNEMAYESMDLTNLTSQSTQTVETQLQNCGGLGAAGLAGLFWSASSRYFYFTDAAKGAPEGCGFWVPPVKYLELPSGTVGDIGYGIRSPDDSKIAAWDASELVVWDVEQGETMRVPALDATAYAGDIAWSPLGTRVAYLQLTWACTPPGRFLLAVVDIDRKTHSLLLTAEQPEVEHVSWKTEDLLQLTDASRTEWIYSLDEHELKRTP